MVVITNPQQTDRDMDDRDVVVMAIGTSEYWLDRCVKDPETIHGMGHPTEERGEDNNIPQPATAGSAHSD
jgi:hypothetical protein